VVNLVSDRPGNDGSRGRARSLYKGDSSITDSAERGNYHAVRVEKLHSAPVIRVKVGRHVKQFLVDTGSSTSLIQPGVCLAKLTQAAFTLFGVTGKTLEVYGNQILKF
jgi:hypothetical protein